MKRAFAVAVVVVLLLGLYVLWPSDGRAWGGRGNPGNASLSGVVAASPMAGGESRVRAGAASSQGGVRGGEGERRICSLTASNRQDYAAVLKRAAAAKLHFEVLPQLNAVIVSGRASSVDNFLLGLGDMELTCEEHRRIDMLPMLDEEKAQAFGTGKPFHDKALQWLGVDASAEGRGKNVTIAVLDTAVDGNSQALKSAHVECIDMFGLSAKGEHSEHGSEVVSLLVGGGDALSGVVPDAHILSIPVVDGDGCGNTADLSQAIVRAADSGVSIISMSLGFTGESALLSQAIDYAVSKGVVVVAAAGNEGPAADGHSTVCYPAACDGVVAVGAVGADGQLAGFSSTGTELTLTAPGVGVDALSSDGERLVFDGTSAAAPYVAGVIAYTMSSQEDVETAVQAASLVLANANDTGLPGTDAEYGVGHVNAQRAVDSATPGIVDLAAAGIASVDNGDGTSTCYFTIQNRGTESIAEYSAECAIDGHETMLLQGSDVLEPGKIVSWKVVLDAGESPAARLSVKTADDGNAENDAASRK